MNGPIPTALRRPRELDYLHLGGNDLTGPVPPWIGDLPNLRVLYLSDNELSGTVPSTLGRLLRLEWLSVSWNPVTGRLPDSLTQIPGLTFLGIHTTAVCAPTDDHFLAWLANVEHFLGETCNRAPAAVREIPAQTVTTPESRGVSVGGYFADPDDDVLLFSAESAQAAQVTAIASGDTVWLSAGEAGEASVTVTACDPDLLCADQMMRVTVRPEGAGASSDREALEAFYDATGGDLWVKNTNWKTAAPLDSWRGVTIGRSGRVTGLRLPENGLTGAVPAALRNLSRLELLDLNWNGLTGPVPAWLGELSRLRFLRLRGNELTGPVPAALGNLQNLRHLYLCCNELTGPVRAALGNLRQLELLDLAWNGLTGPIPSWVTRLANLRYLLLSGNQLSGAVPDGLDALSNLRQLGLSNNHLTPGPIPPELGDLLHLDALWLGRATRTGPIPPELGSLTNLRILSLYGNGLSGEVPDELGGLKSLNDLYLDGNFGLEGPLPPELRLPELERLDLFLTQTCAPEAWQEQLETVAFRGARCGAENREVDVLFVYTSPAGEAAGGTEAMEAEIDLMIATTNQAFRDSDVRTRVALVGRSEVSYQETGESATDLGRLRDPDDGHMDEVHALRDQVGADLVHLIPGASDVGGRAQLRGAFGLSTWPGWAVPHELGHNLGLAHDRYAWAGSDVQSGGWHLSADPAYGHVNPTGVEPGARRSTQWRTIMAYDDQCEAGFTRCPRVNRFSNPRLTYNGDPMGVPFDPTDSVAAWRVTGPSDAARVIDATSPVIAAWRDRPDDSAQPAAAASPAGGPQSRGPGGIGIALPGRPEGLFLDPLPAAQTAPAGVAAARRAPGSPESTSLRRRLVAVDFGQLGETAAELALNLFDDATFTARVERTAPTFSGGFALSGRLAGVEQGTMILVVNGGVVAGRVWTPEATYRIAPAGGGWHEISQVDPAARPPLGDPLPRALPDGDRRDPPRRPPPR